jgi:hypothetical protein
LRLEPRQSSFIPLGICLYGVSTAPAPPLAAASFIVLSSLRLFGRGLIYLPPVLGTILGFFSTHSILCFKSPQTYNLGALGSFSIPALRCKRTHSNRKRTHLNMESCAPSHLLHHGGGGCREQAFAANTRLEGHEFGPKRDCQECRPTRD